MSRDQYLEEAFNLFNEGKISDEAYDAILMNIDEFTNKEEEE
jgi:hypothetical protein